MKYALFFKERISTARDCFFLQACASQNLSTKIPDAFALANNLGWKKVNIPSGANSPFQLAAYININQQAPEGGVLSIYIEGDGHVWRGEFPSQDPTPSYFLALELALRQPRGAI